MKLIMENWRKYSQEEELEEGKLANIVLGAIALGGTLFSPSAMGASTDVAVQDVRQHYADDSEPLGQDKLDKLESIIIMKLFKALEGSGIEIYDKTNITTLLDKEKVSLGDVNNLDTLGQVSDKLNSNMLSINITREKDGTNLTLNLHDEKGNKTAIVNQDIANDEIGSYEDIDAALEPIIKALQGKSPWGGL